MSGTTVARRPYVKDLSIQFGLLSSRGSLVTPMKPGAGKSSEGFKMLCPTHISDPHGVKQRYVCEQDTDSDPFLPGDCLKGREDEDGNLVAVSAEAAAAVRLSDLPEKTLELRAHPYEASNTFASGGAYVYLPDRADQFYATLFESVDSNGVIQTDEGPFMLVGMFSPRKGSEVFCRLERWGDSLVIRELMRPEDVDTFEKVDASVDTKLLDMARQLIVAQAEPFTAEEYKASVRDRIANLIETAKAGGVDIDSLKPKVPEVTDISALLEQSLKQAKAKKES